MNENEKTALIAFDENIPFCLFINEPKEVNDLTEKIHTGYFMNSIEGDKEKQNQTVWIADRSASCYMTNSLKGMKDLREEVSNIKIESRKTIQATKIGT